MIIQKVSYLSDLHFDHNQWNSELSFWKDEIKIFEKELERIVQNWTDKSVLAKAEQFQNLFTVHREGIHTLEHNIRQHEKLMAYEVKTFPEDVEEKYFKNHDDLDESMIVQRKLFRELKKEFLRFLSNYL